ncbi:MAG TPA: hypothetical protein VID72_06420 [Ktedonobacterales bacterium]|jgi:hypothetical protein
MRTLLIGIALFVALLGAVGLGSARPSLALHAGAAQSHLLVDGGATPNTPVCPPGGAGSCG